MFVVRINSMDSRRFCMDSLARTIDNHLHGWIRDSGSPLCALLALRARALAFWNGGFSRRDSRNKFKKENPWDPRAWVFCFYDGSMMDGKEGEHVVKNLELKEKRNDMQSFREYLSIERVSRECPGFWILESRVLSLEYLGYQKKRWW